MAHGPELRDGLVAAYRALAAAGLIAGSSGNISVRSGDGMLISPTGASAERLGGNDLVDMGLHQPVPRASSEWFLHAALYLDRADVGAVVHTHADACTALACLNEDLPAFHYGVLAFGGAVRCAPYTTFGTPRLAELTVEAMRGRTACLLGNHGMVTVGASLAEAAAGAFELERLARQYLLARSAGTPRLLDADEVRSATERLGTYQRTAPRP